MTDRNSRGPGVWVPPPLLFVVGFIIGLLIGRFGRSIHIVPDWAAKPFGYAGLVVVVVGIVIAGWGMITFASAHTAIAPIRPASQLVQHGPYRFTRNPMYTGLTLQYLGGAAMFNSLWVLLMLPIVLSAIWRLVIAREEAYLQREFGPEYEDYKRRVRRWV